jgi:S1-C subfamily serine protease
MTVRCPHCSGALAVSASKPSAAASTPRPAPSAAEDPLWSDPLSSALASAPPSPLGPPRRARRDSKMVILVGVIGGAVVLILGVALIVALSRGPEVAENPAAPAATPTESGEESSPALPPASSPASKPAESTAAVIDPQSPEEAAKPEATDGQNQASPLPPAGEGQGVRAAASETTSTPESSQPSPPATPSAPAVASAPAGSVDLLKLIDPARDAIGPSWTRQGSSLACAGGERWALVVPKPPPAGYRWTIVIERTSGSESISFFLIVDGHQVTAVLENFARPVNGLGFIDGRRPESNESTRPGKAFHDGRPTTVVCTVTRSSVEVVCDGTPLIVWKGSAQRLSYDNTYWHDLPTDRLAVLSYRGVGARIDAMKIEEIDPGEAIPYTGPPPLAGGPGMFRGPRYRSPPPYQPSPQPSEASPSPSQPSAEEKPETLVSSRPAPIIPLEDLPEAVRRSKDSVCIIEHPLGSGTGFVVGENLVATNAHVVDGAYVGELECHFSAAGLEKCRASRVLYEDPVRDLCLLEVVTNQPPIPIKTDHVFQRGEKVVIVGNPAIGETDIVLRDAVTGGTMWAKVHTNKCDFYQIDGTVNPGNSGGPALDYDGVVVAVIAMKATDRGETEIRQALRKYGDSFAGRFGSVAQRGIGFGIPVADLSYALEQVNGQPESAATRVGDRHLANVLLQRMSFAGGINLIRLQLNVPEGVRQQAENIELQIRMRQIPTSTLNKMTRIKLIPAGLASELNRVFDDDEFRKIMRACETGMEGYVKHLSESEQFDPMIARNFEALLRTVLAAKRFADSPPTTYNAFAKAVDDQTKNLDEQVRRLKDQLAVAKAAYED